MPGGGSCSACDIVSYRAEPRSGPVGYVWRMHRQHHDHGRHPMRRPLDLNQSQRAPNQHVLALVSDGTVRVRVPPHGRSCTTLHGGSREARHVVLGSFRVKVWQGGISTGADCIAPSASLEAPYRWKGNSATSDSYSAIQVIVTCHS
jgi:hypothetical protein